VVVVADRKPGDVDDGEAPIGGSQYDGAEQGINDGWNLQHIYEGGGTKTHISFAPFDTKKRSFYQARLGTNTGKPQKEMRLLAGVFENLLDHPSWYATFWASFLGVVFLTKREPLPRQARDTRETLNVERKECVSLRGRYGRVAKYLGRASPFVFELFINVRNPGGFIGENKSVFLSYLYI
jgi:hypothetical protein